MTIIVGGLSFAFELIMMGLLFRGQDFSVQPPICTTAAMTAGRNTDLRNYYYAYRAPITIGAYLLMLVVLKYKLTKAEGNTSEAAKQLRYQAKVGRAVIVSLTIFCFLVGIPWILNRLAYMFGPYGTSLTSGVFRVCFQIFGSLFLFSCLWKNKKFRTTFMSVMKRQSVIQNPNSKES